ncbi:2292_t:CDS:2 [Acaulospora morrowiae]|uniref:2292_t:CDS:1 n=1 Tax=Acaulospora morrowiae TaxID=94023 RepID=A0A9N9BJT3_9GLOM|nr:2292_t:CDS:2 [Acaulospora morrowiae]
MATTKVSNDAGSKNWLKERAAISAAHRRQKTDPAVARLIEKADQLHKERTQRHLHESADGSTEETDEVPEPPVIVEGRDRRAAVKKSLRRSVLFSSPLNVSTMPAEDEEGEDIDAIVNVPPPEEIVVKIAPKNPDEEEITPKHDKESTEDVYRSFAESILEQGLTTESSLELTFDLKPEDIEERHDDGDINQLDNEEKDSKADAGTESLDDDEFEHIEKEETNKESMEEVVVVDIVTTSENND